MKRSQVFFLFVCLLLICGFSQSSYSLADGAILLSGLGAGRSGYWLNGGSQGAEEARNEGEAKASPGAKH